MSHYPESSCLQGTEASQLILTGLGIKPGTCASSSLAGALPLHSTPPLAPAHSCFLRERKGILSPCLLAVLVLLPPSSATPPFQDMPLYGWNGTTENRLGYLLHCFIHFCSSKRKLGIKLILLGYVVRCVFVYLYRCTCTCVCAHEGHKSMTDVFFGLAPSFFFFSDKPLTHWTWRSPVLLASKPHGPSYAQHPSVRISGVCPRAHGFPWILSHLSSPQNLWTRLF
jgi:hypothetical protein